MRQAARQVSKRLFSEKKKHHNNGQPIILLLEDRPDTLIYINLNMPGQGEIMKCATLRRLWAAVLFIMTSWRMSKV